MRPYLTSEQIKIVPLEREYKKKSMGGSITFRKAPFQHRGKNYIVELACKNEVWMILPGEIDRVYRQLGFAFQLYRGRAVADSYSFSCKKEETFYAIQQYPIIFKGKRCAKDAGIWSRFNSIG